MKTPSLLIFSATGGAGHLRAGVALEKAASALSYPVKAKHYDCLDFTSKAFKKVYADSYLALINRAPELWGYLYSLAEGKPYRKRGLLRLFDDFNYQRYLKFLLAEQPDAIIATHFLPVISVSNKLRKAGVDAPVFAVTTDFDAHQYWVDPIVERYYVHHEESAWQLHSKGVPEEKISIHGIPLMQEFRSIHPRDTVRSQLGIEKTRLTLLIISGGFGTGRLEEIVHQTAATLGQQEGKEFTLLVVCGKNERSKKSLTRYGFPRNVDARVFGFVDNIHDLMNASDLLISKSGGLTSAEAMAKQLPMIIVDPIPGQEARNADLVVEQGAGWKAVNLANLSYKIRRVMQQPDLLIKARNAAASLAKPDAANTILDDVCTFLSKGAHR